MAPFLFDSTSANEPIEFEVFFQPGDEYEYLNDAIRNAKKLDESNRYKTPANAAP